MRKCGAGPVSRTVLVPLPQVQSPQRSPPTSSQSSSGAMQGGSCASLPWSAQKPHEVQQNDTTCAGPLLSPDPGQCRPALGHCTFLTLCVPTHCVSRALRPSEIVAKSSVGTSIAQLTREPPKKPKGPQAVSCGRSGDFWKGCLEFLRSGSLVYDAASGFGYGNEGRWS